LGVGGLLFIGRIKFMKNFKFFCRVMLALLVLFGLIAFIIYTLSVKAFVVSFFVLMMFLGVVVVIYEELK